MKRKKWCPLSEAINVLSKAFGWPGFGYKPPPLVVDGQEKAPHQLVHTSNEVERQVELLEWELRRSGIGHRR